LLKDLESYVVKNKATNLFQSQ